MGKNKWLLIAILLLLTSATAMVMQQVQGNVEIIAPSKLNSLLAERKFNRSQPGAKMDGYRILIFFSEDKSRAESIKARFVTEFKDKYDCDVEWDEPNFKVFAGIFKSRIEAQHLVSLLKGYPNAIVVKDKVKYPKL